MHRPKSSPIHIAIIANLLEILDAHFFEAVYAEGFTGLRRSWTKTRTPG